MFPCSDGSFSVTPGCRSQEGERSFSTIAVVALVLPVVAIAVVIVYVAFKRHRRAADAVRTVCSLGCLLTNESARRTTSLGPRQPLGASRGDRQGAYLRACAPAQLVELRLRAARDGQLEYLSRCCALFDRFIV